MVSKNSNPFIIIDFQCETLLVSPVTVTPLCLASRLLLTWHVMTSKKFNADAYDIAYFTHNGSIHTLYSKHCDLLC